LWLPEGKVKKAEPTKNSNPPRLLRMTIPCPLSTLLWDEHTSERQISDLAKLFLSADQINLYFIQLFVFIWQFCGTY
jgi:hypothetical protein